MKVSSKISLKKDIISRVIILLSIASVFLFPDVNLITYIGRILVIILFVVNATRIGRIKNRFYFLWSIFLSIILVINLAVSIDKTLTLSMFFAMFTAIWSAFSIFEWVKSRVDMQYIFNCIVLCEMLFCIRLLQYIEFGTWGQRKVGTMLGINVNSIGLRLAFTIIITLFFLYSKKGKQRFLYLVFTVVCCAMILVTGSRRALILAFISIVVFMIINSDNPLKTIRTVIFLLLLVIIAMQLIINIPQLYNIIGARLITFLNSIMDGNISSAFDDGRDVMVDVALELFLEKPIFGWGLGTFSVCSGYNIAYSHNNFVELLFALGIFGFLIYYSFLIYSLLKIKLIRNYKQEYCISVGILLLLFFSDFAAVNATTLVTHLFIGIVLTYIRGI